MDLATPSRILAAAERNRPQPQTESELLLTTVSREAYATSAVRSGLATVPRLHSQPLEAATVSEMLKRQDGQAMRHMLMYTAASLGM